MFPECTLFGFHDVISVDAGEEQHKNRWHKRKAVWGQFVTGARDRLARWLFRPRSIDDWLGELCSSETLRNKTRDCEKFSWSRSQFAARWKLWKADMFAADKFVSNELVHMTPHLYEPDNGISLFRELGSWKVMWQGSTWNLFSDRCSFVFVAVRCL